MSLDDEAANTLPGTDPVHRPAASRTSEPALERLPVAGATLDQAREPDAPDTLLGGRRAREAQMLLNGVNHVAILTHDTGRLAAFYREVFDAEIGSHLDE